MLKYLNESSEAKDKSKERLELAKFMIKSSNRYSTSVVNLDGTIATAQDIAKRATKRFNNPKVKKMIEDLIKRQG